MTAVQESNRDTDTGATASARANVQFTFKHRVFAVDGCVFRKNPADQAVSLYMPLGQVLVGVPLDKLAATFEIPAESEDARLLKRVKEAVRYVKEVRPGDSIPSEIVDGRASWMVEEKYLAAAKARISLQLVAWLSGNHSTNLGIHELIAFAEQSETRQKVQQAFSSIAEKLGYRPDQKQEVVDLVDRLAGELSYVEALRDRFNGLRKILATLHTLCAGYRRDRNMMETIMRCTTLLAKPAQKIFDRFDALDANTGEIVNTLRRFSSQVAYLREVRDDLREIFLLWEPLIASWADIKPVVEPDTERTVQKTYRFAARNFSAGQAWAGSH